MKQKQKQMAALGAGVGAGLGLFYVAVARYAHRSCTAIHTTAPGTETYADDTCAKAHPIDYPMATNPVVAFWAVAAAAGVGAAVAWAGSR